MWSSRDGSLHENVGSNKKSYNKCQEHENLHWTLHLDMRLVYKNGSI